MVSPPREQHPYDLRHEREYVESCPEVRVEECTYRRTLREGGQIRYRTSSSDLGEREEFSVGHLRRGFGKKWT